MEQNTLFDAPKTPKKKYYRKSGNENTEFSPTFSDRKFVAQFDEFCRRNHLNKTETAQKWMRERLDTEIKDEINSLTREELIERIMETMR